MKVEKSAGVIVFYFPKLKKGELKKEPIFLLLEYPTYWGFIRGNIEKNESIKQTIKREAKEEANISEMNIIEGFKETQSWFYKLKGKLRRKFAPYLLAEITEKQAKKVRISFEHKSFKFLKLQDALKIMRIKNEREMLKKASSFIENYKKQKELF